MNKTQNGWAWLGHLALALVLALSLTFVPVVPNIPGASPGASQVAASPGPGNLYVNNTAALPPEGPELGYLPTCYNLSSNATWNYTHTTGNLTLSSGAFENFATNDMVEFLNTGGTLNCTSKIAWIDTSTNATCNFTANPGYNITDGFANLVPMPAGSGSNSSDPFYTIQGAINAASANDTVIVADSTYNLTATLALNVMGVILQGDTTTPGNVVINASANDPAVDITAVNVTVEGFTITTDTPVVHSIRAASGANGTTISRNVIENVAGTNASQIALSGVSHCAVLDNTLTESFIWLASVSNSTISGNNVSGVTGAGDITIQPTSTDILIQGNSLSHGAAGICIPDTGPGPYVVDGLQILGNDITDNTKGNGEGIAIGPNIVWDAGNAINNNNIYGNTYGIRNYMSTVVDAENNWWGSANGPYIMSGTDSADNVRGYVDFWNWLDAPYATGSVTDNDGLVVGNSYTLYMKHSGLANATIYLDDIGNDALYPADSDAYNASAANNGDANIYSVSNDVALASLGSDGKGAFTNVSPLYATSNAANETREYIGIANVTGSVLHWLEAVPGDISSTTNIALSPSSLTYNTTANVTATVTKVADGSAVVGEIVKLYLDDEGDAKIDETEFKVSSSTGADGKATFVDFTPDAAGKLVAVVSADSGGKLGAPTQTDTIPDGSTKTQVTINPVSITVTPSPAQLFKSFTTNVTITGACAVNVTGLNVTLLGCGVNETASMDITGGTGNHTFANVTANATGSIAVNVSKNEGAATTPLEYLGTSSISVVEAAPLNVVVSPTATQAAGAAFNLTVGIQGSDGTGPHGDAANTTLPLKWAKTVVSIPVGQTKSTGTWNGTNTTALLVDATFVSDKTIKFLDVLPNDASSNITVTVTGELYDHTAVGPVTKTIPVSGFVVTAITPSEDQIIDTTSDISVTVTTKLGDPVSTGVVNITAPAAAGFQKDVDATSSGLESFGTITINGSTGKISYDGANPEDFSVIGGFYQVTGIKFAELGGVTVDVADAGASTKAGFSPAFSVIGEQAYTLSDFVPAKLTAGVNVASLNVTVTNSTGGAVSDAANITVGVPVLYSESVTGQTPTDGVYTITPNMVLSSNATTLTVKAFNADNSKWGNATLDVALPSVSEPVITDADGNARTVMLTTANYTANVTAYDALGEGLANAKVWLGYYNATANDVLPVVANTTCNSTGFASLNVIATNLTKAGSLIWKVSGTGVVKGNAALVEEPSISVEAPAYSLDYQTPVVAGESLTVSVLNNYDELQKYLSIIVRNPDSTTDDFSTGNTGTFSLVSVVVGDYEVYHTTVLEANLIDTITVVSKVLESIAASPSEVSLTAVNETAQLAITATYSDNSTANVTADSTYVSNNVTVATVSTGGLITAVGEGSTNVTVSYTEAGIEATATVSVTVTEGPVTIRWNCLVDHTALIAPLESAGRADLTTSANLTDVTMSISDGAWFQVLWLDESVPGGEWNLFISLPEYAGTNTLHTLEPGKGYYVIVAAPSKLTIPQ